MLIICTYCEAPLVEGCRDHVPNVLGSGSYAEHLKAQEQARDRRRAQVRAAKARFTARARGEPVPLLRGARR